MPAIFADFGPAELIRVKKGKVHIKQYLLQGSEADEPPPSPSHPDHQVLKPKIITGGGGRRGKTTPPPETETVTEGGQALVSKPTAYTLRHG
ncbi:hypothetical protein RB213_013108 [Colletotrichum asianum]